METTKGAKQTAAKLRNPITKGPPNSFTAARGAPAGRAEGGQALRSASRPLREDGW